MSTAAQRVRAGAAAVAAGELVVVTRRGAEPGATLAVAADRVDAAAMATLVQYSSGFVCVAVTAGTAHRLWLPPLSPLDDTFRVSVDAAAGITTGISAHDRAETARLLAAGTSRPEDLIRPGHVVPLVVPDGGCAERPGAAEAAVDLARLGGVAPAMVVAPLVSERTPTVMADAAEAALFAAHHGLLHVDVADVRAALPAVSAARG